MKAFPSNYIWDENNETYNGMDLRDYFAGLAMEGIIFESLCPEQIAKFAYEMADEMMKAREQHDRMEEEASVPKD